MIYFQNVSFKIKNKQILKDISFSINDGEKVLIYGVSGGGKTTIFNLLLKNINPDDGTIYVNKQNISTLGRKKEKEYRRRTIKAIYQKDDLFDHLSVNDNLLLFFYQKDIDKYLSSLNLSYLKDVKVGLLSGGERQRVSIIKTLLFDPTIILADEITSAIDKEEARRLIDFILTITKRKTVIFISHDLTLFSDKVDHFIKLSNGKIIDERINDIKVIEKRKEINEKNANKSIINDAVKRFSFSSFLIFILVFINVLVCFSIEDFFTYLSVNSYKKYIDYDVLYLKDDDYLINDENIFYSLDSFFYEALIKINNIKVSDYSIYPFNNKDNIAHIIVSSILITDLNIKDNIEISIENGTFEYIEKDIEIVKDDNMFSDCSIYYDLKYFSSLGISKDNQRVIIDYDFRKTDSRFTNNPMFYKKEDDKPYLSSKAYDDYLTYIEIYKSIKEIVNYFFIIILLYSVLTSVLINISFMLKDGKKIAIYISNGYSNMKIKASYYLTNLIYFSMLLPLSYFYLKVLYSLLFCLSFVLISIEISYQIIKRKPLYKLLTSEDMN